MPIRGRLTVVTIVANAIAVAAAGPAGAHTEVGAGPPPAWSFVASRSALTGVVVGGTMVVAGLLMVGAALGSTPPARPRRLRFGLRCAAVASLAADLLLLSTGWRTTVLGGWPRLLVVAHLALTVAALVSASSVSAEALPGPRGGRARRWALPALLVTSLGLAGQSGPGDGWRGGLQLVVEMAHLGAASLWVGLVAHLALSWSAVALRRLRNTASVAGGLTVLTGLAQLPTHLTRLDDLTLSGYGQLLVAKVALVVVVAFLGLRAARRLSVRATSGEAAALAGVVVLAAVLVGLPAPAAVAAPGIPVLRRVVLAGADLTVLITPNRPGRNVVRVTTEKPVMVSVADDRRRTVPLLSSGDGKSWTGTLQLGSERGSVRVGVGSAVARLTVDPGRPRRTARRLEDASAGAATAGCLDRHVGHLVAVGEEASAGTRFSVVRAAPGREGDLGSCLGSAPVAVAGSALEAEPDIVGSAFVRFLADRGVGRVTIVSDATGAARAFVAGARRAAGPAQRIEEIDVSSVASRSTADDEAVVVTSELAASGPALAALTRAGAAPVRGTFLAPWLLDSTLLGTGLGRDAGQLSVGLTFDPNGAGAQHYLNALDRQAPGSRPSSAGLIGYVEARLAMISRTGRLEPSRSADAATLRKLAAVELSGSYRPGPAPALLRFYTPTRATILPAPFDNHDHAGPSWVEGGALAAVSAPVQL